MMQIFNYNPTKKMATLGLKVTPKAKINVIGQLLTINKKQYLKLSIKAAAENGKANQEIVDFLSKKWRIPKRSLEIISGATNNLKILSIKNIELEQLIRIFEM